ncbi:Dimer-Tnp-hAT domain-containing protein [Mycena venus]|uniref:Dimer-Tnp-hAT domain-containing protein n=1 Tax=Mycena venus TaxID=2733690 RepID=A0A8H6XH27_9AGAR|nr:Dimer-Tnp-hAT domain-containing protein [Mycena venus]
MEMLNVRIQLLVARQDWGAVADLGLVQAPAIIWVPFMVPLNANWGVEMDKPKNEDNSEQEQPIEERFALELLQPPELPRRLNAEAPGRQVSREADETRRQMEEMAVKLKELEFRLCHMEKELHMLKKRTNEVESVLIGVMEHTNSLWWAEQSLINNILTDTWSTRSMMFTFTGTIASWVSEDWQLIERVIDFHPNGDKGARGHSYGLTMLTKNIYYLLTLSLDNASKNDVLIRALSDILRQGFNIQWAPENSQIHCIAHVVNLVVQKSLATLDEAHDREEQDYCVPNKDLPFHYDPDSDPELTALEKEQFEKEHYATTDEDSEIGLITALKPEFETLSAVGKTADERAPSGKPLTSLMAIRDVKTRWNYTEAMITRGLLLRKAIDQWMDGSLEDAREFGEGSQGIHSQVTLEMSCSGTPTLPFVLPMYETMMTSLQEHAADRSLLRPLQAAAIVGLAKLTVYYEKAKQCQFNVIATTDVKVLNLPPTTRQPKPTRTARCFLDTVCMVDVDLPVNNVPPREPEFKRFYDAAITYGSGELNAPLAWWKIHERDFPVIAAMARDFFAIPGTSVSVERLFSKSRHLCRETRSSMHADTIMKAMLTKMWIKAGLFKSKQS